jgi:hypothetical protein
MNSNLRESIIAEFKNSWRYPSLRCIPAEARPHLPKWRDPDSVIDPDISQNLSWETRCPFKISNRGRKRREIVYDHRKRKRSQKGKDWANLREMQSHENGTEQKNK